MDRQEMNRLESDIAIIKEAIRANNGFIRQFLAGSTLSGFFIAFGAVTAALGLVWHLALAAHGSFSTMPVGLRIALIVITIVASAALAAAKTISIARAARMIDQNFSWFGMFQKLSDHPLSIAQGLIVLMSICCAIFAGIQGESTIVVGIVTGGLAVVFLLYAVAFLLTEYLPISIGLFLVTILAVVIPTLAPLLLFSGGMGGVFIVCGLLLRFSSIGDR